MLVQDLPLVILYYLPGNPGAGNYFGWETI